MIKIKKIKFNKHHLLSGITLDFTIHTNQIANSIIICGENGTGKTSIMEIISSALGQHNIHRDPFDIDITAIQEEEDCTKNKITIGTRSGSSLTEKEFIINAKKETQESDITKTLISPTNAHIYILSPNILNYHNNNYFYSRQAHTTSHNTSTKKEIGEMSSKLLFDQAAKYWQDIKTHICSYIIECSDKKNEIFDYPRKDQASELQKLNLFKINNIIEKFIKIKIDELPIKDRNNIIEPQVYNVKTQTKYLLDKLSIGEKHIISQIITYCKASRDIFIIDEPEYSLHPYMQSKLLTMYHDLSKIDNKCKQFIISTHSIPVLYNTSDNTKIINLSYNKSGKLSANNSSPTAKKVSKESLRFDQITTQYICQPYLDFIEENIQNKIILVEGESDSKIITHFLKEIKNETNFVVKDCRSASQLQSILNHPQLNQNTEIYAFFDTDSEGFERLSGLKKHWKWNKLKTLKEYKKLKSSLLPLNQNLLNQILIDPLKKDLGFSNISEYCHQPIELLFFGIKDNWDIKYFKKKTIFKNLEIVQCIGRSKKSLINKILKEKNAKVFKNLERIHQIIFFNS